MAPEAPEQARFLYLLFEESQSKVDVVMVHFDNDHGITSDAIDGDALPLALPD